MQSSCTSFLSAIEVAVSSAALMDCKTVVNSGVAPSMAVESTVFQRHNGSGVPTG